MTKTIRINNNNFLAVLRNVNLNQVAAGSDVELFTPFTGKKLVIRQVITVTKAKTGTVTTPPQWKLTNGTTDIVAAGAHQNATVGASANLTIAYGANTVGPDDPLTWVETVRQVGGTKYTADIVIAGYFI